jgi:hypothetical protein
MMQQRLVALRHREIPVGCDLTQVSHRGLDVAGHRLALVDIEGPAVVEHEAEIVVAAGGVMPGRPVHDHRRLIGEEGELREDHRLVRAPHALRVDHGLRRAGRARREQELGDGVRADLPVGGVAGARRRGGQQLVEQYRRPVGDRIAADHDLDAGRYHRFDGTVEGTAVGHKDKPGREQVDDVFELLEVVRKQRIGRRDRCVGNADMDCGEPEERMLDVVAGEDDDRPLG